MKYTKKMVIIPEELLNRIQQQTDLQTTPLLKAMGNLNEQMDHTLASHLPDDVKLKHHEQQFQRFLNLQEQRENVIPTVKIHQDITTPQEAQDIQPPPPQEPQPPQQRGLTNADIVRTVPKTFKTQAEGLLEWIKRSPEAISWDDKGTVSLEGQPIQGTSITDLVNDVLRKRKGFNPAGRDDFAVALARLNTPENFIRNDDRRQFMLTLKNRPPRPPITPEDAATLFPTPPSRPRKRFASPLLQQKMMEKNARRGLNWIEY